MNEFITSLQVRMDDTLTISCEFVRVRESRLLRTYEMCTCQGGDRMRSRRTLVGLRKFVPSTYHLSSEWSSDLSLHARDLIYKTHVLEGRSSFWIARIYQSYRGRLLNSFFPSALWYLIISVFLCWGTNSRDKKQTKKQITLGKSTFLPSSSEGWCARQCFLQSQGGDTM